MGDDRRWAARYQFLEELWRERDRIIFDPEIEATLQTANGDGPSGELLELLLPSADPDARVWMVLTHDRRAAALARGRGGTVFFGLDAAAELASDEDWGVAIIHLPELSGGSARSIPDGVLALLDVLGDRCDDDPDRSVVLAVPVDSGAGDRVYEALAELVEDSFGDARIYGLTQPGMAASYDFGRLFETDDADSEPEIPIEIDTSLGSDPHFGLYLAVIGDRVPADGLTFIELPATGSSERNGDEAGAIRAQLAEVQKRGDLQAIDRLALLEQLEQAEARAEALEDELERVGGTGTGQPEPTRAEPRIDAVLAREQSLRWELDRVRGELDNLRARPVEALEAEAAVLRVRLGEAEAALHDGGLEPGAKIGEDDIAVELVVHTESPARSREHQRLRARIDRLLARLERGAEVSALELHRELAALRRLL